MTSFVQICGVFSRFVGSLVFSVAISVTGAAARTLVIESSPPTGVQVTVSPADNLGATQGVTNFTLTYADAAAVIVTAPNVVGRYRFLGWVKNGEAYASSLTTQVTLTSDQILRAVYQEVAPVFPTDLRVMPLGDSITYGYNGGNAGYRGPLYSLLSPLVTNFRYQGTSVERPGNLPLQPINQRFHEGHSSYNIQDISNNLDGLDTTRFFLLGGPDRDPKGGYWLTGGNGTGRTPVFPDVITLMAGHNDLNQMPGVEERLVGLLTKITTLRPDTKLVVAKVTPVPSLSSDEVYNPIISRVVGDFQTAGKNVYLVDLNTGFPINGLDPDGVHPNNTGFNWMASHWFEGIVAAYSPTAVKRPFHALPVPLPGTIQAENFNFGGPGIAYSDTSAANEGGEYRPAEGVDIQVSADSGEGYQVFQTQAGEWLEYSVTVGQSGGFTPSLRVATPSAGAEVFLEVDGIDVTNNVALPATGGTGNWQTVMLPEIQLSTGEHVLRLVISSTGASGSAGAVNWLNLAATSLDGPSAQAGPDLEATDTNHNGTELVALNASGSTAGDSPNLTYTWWRGGTQIASGLTANVTLPVGVQVIQLTVTDGNGLKDTDELFVTVKPKPLVNGSFESGFTGWTISGSTQIQTASPYSPTDGVKLAGFNGGDQLPSGILSQSIATAPGGTYTLAFDAGALSFNGDIQTMRVTATGSGNLLTQTVSITGPGGGATRWLPQSFTFVANSQTTTLSFRDLSGTTTGIDLVLDNVRVSGPPASPANTAPVALAESYTTNENIPLVVPAGGLLVNDSDADGNLLVAVPNVLPKHGTLTMELNGGFTYTPANGYFGSDSFTYHASDQFLNSNIVTVSLFVNEVIPAPIAAGDVFTTDENTQLAVPASGVLTNDDDLRSRPLTAVLDADPDHGNLVMEPDGSFIYTPVEGYFGNDSFTYHCRNGFLDSEIVTVSLVINEVIPPPVSVADAYATNENSPLSVSATGVLANDSDPRSRPITAALGTGPEHGTVILNSDGSFTYTPDAFYYGADSFTYRSNNGFLDSSPVMVALTVNEVVPPPVALADFHSTDENVPLLVPGNGLLANDSDPRGRSITAVPRTQPTHGTLVINPNGGFLYTPAAGYYGPDSFTYQTNNGVLDSAPATVFLNVNEVIPPPVGVADGFATDEDIPLVVPTSGVLANDSDPRGRPLTALLAEEPAHGMLVLNANGSFTYTPDPGYFGSDFFIYFAKNGFLASELVTVNLTVDEVVPPPVAAADFHSTNENVPLLVPGNGLLANDSDPRGRSITAVPGTQPTHGTLVLNPNGGFLYTPAAGYYGPDSFTYQANNGFLDSAPATVFVNVNEVIPPPVGVADGFTTDEDVPLVVPASGVLANDSDPRGRPLTALLAEEPAHGTLVFNANGSFTYTPNLGYFGSDSFIYFAKNGFLASELVTVRLTVNEVVPPPVAAADFHSTNENVPLSVLGNGLLANDSDPRGRSITAVPGTQPTHGTLVLNPNGGFLYTPAAGYYGPDSFTYQANNGFLDSAPATVFVNVNEVIPPPVGVADGFTTDEDVPLVVPASGVLANDSDPRGRPLTALLAEEPAHGTLVFNANGSFTYTPNPGYFGSDSFIYFAKNGFLASELVTVSLTVNEVVPPPVAVANHYATDESVPLSIPANGVLANDSDPRGRPLTAVLKAGANHGVIILNANGSFLYTPAANYFGSDSFTYQANNGVLGSNTVTVGLTVNEVIPPPVAVADSYATQENDPLIVSAGGILANDSDPRGRPLTPEIVADPTNGALTLNSNGSFSYIPLNGFFGTDSFTYRINNGFLNSNVSMVEITVNERIPAPVAAADMFTTNENTALVIPASGVLANDSDPRSRPLTALLESGPSHGTLALAPGGGFSYTPAANFFGNDSFSYRARNGFVNSEAVTVSLTVNEVVPPPVAVADSYVTNENSPLTAPGNGVLSNDSDPRSRSLTAVLETAPSNGTVSLNPSGSFTYTPLTGFYGSDFFTYRASNGVLNSNLATVSLTVQEVIPAPIAVADSYTTLRGTTLTIPAAGVLINDTDLRLRPLTAVLVSGPGQGTLALAPSGAFTYSPVIGFSGTDTFTYRARNGFLNSSPVTVTITVAGINFVGPVNGSFESGFTNWTVTGNAAIHSSVPYVPSNGSKLVGFNGADSTPNAVISQSFDTSPGDTYTLTFDVGVLSYNTNSQTMQVTATGNGSLLTRSITFNGLSGGSNRWLPQSFTFVANSPLTTLTFRDQSVATLNLDMTLDNVRVTGPPVVPTNTAPVAVADSYSTNQNTALVVPASGVLANDTDAQSQPLTAIISVGPTNGNVTLNTNGGFTYTPNSGYSGSDSFTYRANDGSLNSNIATVSLSVVPTNTAPMAVADSYSTSQNTALIIAASGVLANDTDAQSQPLTAIISVGPTNGSVTLNANGGFTYTPNSGYSGSDSFTYRANDGALNSNIATVSLSVISSNTAPVAVADSYSTNQNTALIIAASGVLANDTDAQSQPLTAIISVGPTNGSVTLNANGGFTYTPNSGYSGSDSFTYRANDGSLNSNIATVSLSVVPTNTAPMAVADSYSTSQNTALIIAASGVLANDTDAQSQPLTAILSVGPTNGTVTLNANGGFTYTPNSGYSGSDSFTYRANDGLLNSNIATVSVAVAAPVSVGLVNGSFESDFTGWTASGVQHIQSAAPYVATAGSKLIGFNAANLTPNAVLSQSFATTAGVTYTLEFDLGVLAYNTNAQTMQVAVSGTGNLLLRTLTVFGVGGGVNRWVPQNFTFVANSPLTTLRFTDQSTSTLGLDMTLDNVRVTGPPQVTNTAPIAVADSYSTNQDTVLVISPAGVLANDTDAQAQPLTANLVANPTNGVLALAPNGGFTYTPNPGFAGVDSFTYRANDGNLNSTTVGVSLTVIPVVPPPVAIGDSYSTNEGIPLVVPAAGVLENDSDPGSLPLTAVIVTSPLNGTLTLNLNGSFEYAPAAGYFGSDSFTYRASNGSATSAVTTVSLTINEIVPAPLAVADSYTTGVDTALVISLPGVLANDTDARSRPLTAVLESNPAFGSLTLNTDGSFTYTPNAGYAGSDSFTYRARNGFLNSNVATVGITVSQVAFAALVNGSFESNFTGWTATGNLSIHAATPYAASDGTKLVGFNGANLTPNAVLSQSFATVLGQSYTLTFDVGVLSYLNATQTLQVTVQGANNLLTRVITLNGSGNGITLWEPRSFTFIANSTSSTLTFRDQSASSQGLDLVLDNVRISGASPPANTAPVAVADTYSTNQNTALVVPASGVLANDTDPQAQPLTAAISSGPANGTVTFNTNGGFTYTPNNGYVGTDSFTYRANDGLLNSNIATVTLTVNSTNTAPVAVADNYSTNQNTALVVPASGVLANDTDAQAQPLTAAISSGPANGTVTFNTNGGFTYTPNNGYVGTDSFTYRANDGLLNSNIATVTLTVNSTNTAPVAVADSFSTNQNTALVIPASGVLANDTDAQAQPLTAAISTGPANGTVNLNANGGFTYTPNNGYFGTDSFTYRANDGLLNSNIATVTLTVISTNTAPVAVTDSYSTNQNTALVVPASGVLANDTDAQAQPLTAAISTGPANGTVNLNANGGFTYTPNNGYSGTDSFTYRANDGFLNSNPVPVNISVVAPVAVSLVNGSFESGFTGWTISGSQAVQSSAPYVATHGTKLVGFNGGNQTPSGVLSQTFATTPGQNCTLTFDAGVFSYNTNSQTLQVTVNGAGNLLTRTVTIFGTGGGTNRWVPQSFSFVANSTSTTLTFRDQSSSTNALDLLLDNVRVSSGGASMQSLAMVQSLIAPTEEPGSLTLTGTPGDFTIRMAATQPGTYVLECSENLTLWKHVSKKQVSQPGELEFRDTRDPLDPRPLEEKMFYRVGRLPNPVSE